MHVRHTTREVGHSGVIYRHADAGTPGADRLLLLCGGILALTKIVHY